MLFIRDRSLLSASQLASVRWYGFVRFGVMCWCLCLFVYGGNYGFLNPVLTMWQLMMFYLHASEPLVFFAQESQSPPRYFVVATGLIFGL
jgi:hypothetical protein